MGSRVKTILQKINFIETDMEIHRQILVSIDPQDRDQIRDVVGKIAGMKARIQELKQDILNHDPDEYQAMMKIETAVSQFKEQSRNKTFSRVKTLNETGECRLVLDDGQVMDCLVAAQENNGNWMVLTLEGLTMELASDRVRS